MTFYEKHKVMQKIVQRILYTLQHMPTSSLNGEQSCWDHDAQSPLKAGILYFKPPAQLGRGELKSKGGGKKTIHYNGCEETVELILPAEQSKICATN